MDPQQTQGQGAATDPEAGAVQVPVTEAPPPAGADGAGLRAVDTAQVKRGPKNRTSLAFKDMHYSVKLRNGDTKEILKGCSGAVAPGEVLAIMGPSGSGKTSLLDALANRLRSAGAKLDGEVLFNGKKISSRRRRKIMSYVAQEDTLLGVFTVRETLWFAARFYFGYREKYETIESKVEALIDSVGLRSCADTGVGNIFFKGLSGGQRKRLSIAVELISSPSILLLDEPTSGLDSSSAYAIMEELGKLSRMGHTIVATIHQPSSEIWAKFDQFMLLGEGWQVYFGPASVCPDYFAGLGYVCPAQFNPADFVTGLVATDFDIGMFKRPESTKVLADAFAASEMKTTVEQRIALGARITPRTHHSSPATSGTELALDGASATAASTASPAASNASPAAEEEEHADDTVETCYQRKCVAGGGRAGFGSNLRTLLHRNMVNMIRNPGIILVREIMYLMLALFLGLTFLYVGRTYNSASIVARNSLLFFVAAFFVFMSVAVMPFIIEERAVFLREKRNGAYTVAPYVLAQFITLLPGTFFIAITTSILIVFMISLNGFGYYVLCLWLSLIYAECFVILVGSISPHYIIGIAAAAGFFGLCMVVEGFFIVFPTIGWWIRWLGYITPHRYSFRAFMRNEYCCMPQDFDVDAGFTNGTEVLMFYGMIPSPQFYTNEVYIQSIGGDLGIMFLFSVSYLFLFWLVCEFYWK